jgi:hypothetical protein
MRKYNLTSALLLLTLICPLRGKSTDGERMLLATDRGLYVAGEIIHFTSTLYTQDKADPAQSTIAYIELITPNGEKILGQKRLIQNGICKGAFTVPSEVLSGNYYLRAYTKVMRNHPAEIFGYCLLKIINPERSEILVNNNHEVDDHHTMLEMLKLSDAFKIEVDADTVSTRKEVQVKISRQDAMPDQFSQTIVSIVPAISRQQTMLTTSPFQNDTLMQGPFLAESDGPTISGTIAGQKQPGPVNITLLGSERNNFYPVLTDSSGRFSFAFREKYGEQDLFISFNEKNPDADLLIDNDFCSKKTVLPSPPFVLNENERNFLLEAAHHQKINNYFNSTAAQDGESKPLNQVPDTIPFYGKPDHEIYVSDYIQMSQLKDYLTELPVPVRIRKKEGEEFISILGAQAEMQIFPPLLMVDFAPVYDVGTILQMDPEKVLRFDILVSPYIRGEMTYGGILNVISNNNDFAGIKLPEKGLFVNYHLLTDKNGFHNRTTPLPPHIPDTRSTLYWNPSIDFGHSDTRTFRFLSGDMQGNYVIQVTGITSSGERLITEKQIYVVQ